MAFATQPNNVTADGTGDNSPFTQSMLEHLGTEGISISDMMIRVRNAVEEKTYGRQTPWDQSSLRAQFYFKPKNESAALSQADYEMLAALDPETRQRLLSLMGAENIKFDEDKVEDMEVAIQVASLTDSLPSAQPVEQDGALVITALPADDALTDEQLDEIMRVKTADVEEGADEPVLQIKSILTETAPVEPTAVAVATNAGTVEAESGAAGEAAAATGGDRVIASASGTAIAVPVSTLSVGTVVRRGGPEDVAEVDTGAAGAVAGGTDGSAQPMDVPVLTAALLPQTPTISVYRAIPELRMASLDPAPSATIAATRGEVFGQEPDAEDLEIVGVTEASWPRLEGRALARAVQSELSRLGCYRMAVDGAFGRGSKLSLVRYYGNKGVAAQSLEPTNSLLQVLRAEPQVVCENTTEISNSRVAAISSRVSQARERVAPAQAKVVQKQRLGAKRTVTTSSGEEKAVTGIRAIGGFR